MVARVACPACGSPGWSSPGPCSICGHADFVPLRFVLQNGTTIEMGRLRTALNRTWARATLGPDGEFWAKDWQMVLRPDWPRWVVEPNPSAVNETLVDGRRISVPVSLVDGMVLAVGREYTGVIKTPLGVSLG